MDELRTGKGRIFHTDYVAACPQPPMLFIRVFLEEDATIEDVNAVFKDPTETSVITYAGRNYEGYTKNASIKAEGNVAKVRLRK